MHVRARAGVVAFAAACLALTSVGCGEPTAEDRVADTMRRTEDIHGLSAIEPVPYRFLPGDEAFDDLIDDWLESDAAQETEADALVMQRLGLLPLDFDILEVLEWSTRSGVPGYYDREAKRMTIVSDPDEVGPGDLMVLAHEHAHALQDQHFGLGEPEEPLDDDQAAARDALVEGEATLVMAIWAMKRLGAMDVEELEASDIPTDVMPVDEVPDILYRLGEFPYVDGAAFVFDKWGDGDWSAIDALWANPPVSSEQILHPDRYPDDVPDVVEMPDVAAALGPGWEVAAEMVMGEMQIGVLLADGEPWGCSCDVAFSFPELENARAAEGWGGDRLVHVTGPEDDWVIVWQTTWDRSRDAREFSAAAEAAFEDLPFSAVVMEGTDVTDGSLRHPVLVMITPDVATRVRTLAALAPA